MKNSGRTWGTIACRQLLRSALVLVLVLTSGTPASSALAETFIVDSTADAVDANLGDGICASDVGECTLRAAAEEAGSRQADGPFEIALAPGEYALTLGALELEIAPRIAIRGAGVAVTRIVGTIRATALTLEQTTVVGFFDASPRMGGPTMVRNAKIEGTVEAGDLLLEDSEVVGSVGVGRGSLASILRTTVRDGSGVGVAVRESGNATVTDSAIVGHADRGISCSRCNDFIIRGTTVANNRGAGVTVTFKTGAVIEGSTIAGNGDGGVFLAFASATIVNSTISDNRKGLQASSGSGGGVAVDGGDADIAIVNSTISGNRASRDGGGLYVSNCCGGSATVSLHNVTVANNLADADGDGDGDGGGMMASAGLLRLENTLLANNEDAGGEAPDCGGSGFTSLGYNFLQDPSGCVVFGETVGNIVGQPAFLDTLRVNGGQTATHALLRQSPAIDGGNPAGCTDDGGVVLTADQRGTLRPQFTRCDIGAYEFACGNGTIDPGETCDGNAADGGCCSSACTLETCTDCEACSAGKGCVAAPLASCRQPTAPFSSPLQLVDGKTDKLSWTWNTGTTTTLGDFGDPLGGDRYVLCVYDESGTTPQVSFRAATRSRQCDKRPCWHKTGKTTFSYKDATTPDGLDALLLKSGADGKAKILATAKGTDVGLPPLPLALPARVQLHATNGQCWEARYFDLGATRNGSKEFKGKAFTP